MIIELDSERGKALGFTSDRFDAASYLWDEECRVMVSAIISKAPGNFKALVAAIHAEGKTVAVPTPLAQMRRIVEKNGYIQQIEIDPQAGPVEVWTLDPPDKESDR